MVTRHQFTFHGSTPNEATRFIRDHMQRMSYLRRVVVESGRTRVIDVNRSEMVFPQVTFGHPLLRIVLVETEASFDPLKIEAPPPGFDGVREYGCSKKYPWAHDRVD
jgi:hypothetical protein